MINPITNPAIPYSKGNIIKRYQLELNEPNEEIGTIPVFPIPEVTKLEIIEDKIHIIIVKINPIKKLKRPKKVDAFSTPILFIIAIFMLNEKSIKAFSNKS